jgi:hypothetical protein
MSSGSDCHRDSRPAAHPSVRVADSVRTECQHGEAEKRVVGRHALATATGSGELADPCEALASGTERSA